MTNSLKLTLDTAGLAKLLSALSDAADLLPEVRDGLIGLLDSGEQLLRIDCDGSAAALTTEIVVRLKPSDALLRLLPASGAGDIDFCVLEHAASPVELLDVITTSGTVQ